MMCGITELNVCVQYVCMYVCMYVCVCACMHEYMHVCISQDLEGIHMVCVDS